MLIIIDAGHGGKDSGAVGPSGLKEKDVVLSVAKKLKKSIERYGEKVKLTRDEDVYLTLSERAQIANRANAEYFISIHCNSYIEPRANGCEAYVYAKRGETYEVAKSIYESLNGEIKLTSRGVKEAPFTVLTKTHMPAVLVEIAFISNFKEEKLLGDDTFLDRVAEAITKGLYKHLGIEIDKKPSQEKPSMMPEEEKQEDKPAKEDAKDKKSDNEKIHWGQASIDELIKRGIITSNKDPNSPVTWAEFATVALRILDK